MPTDQQQQRMRAQQQRSEDDMTFSQDELTALLQQASQLDSRKVAETHPVSLADALQTARDLGIPEENVLMAADDLKRAKFLRTRRSNAIRMRRNHFIRFLFLALAISIGITFTSSLHAGLAVLAAMSIPLLIIGSRWATAAMGADETSDHPVAGVCRICGATAWNPNATFCNQHKLG